MTITLCCQECGHEEDFEDEDEINESSWWCDDNGDWYCEDCYGVCDQCGEHCYRDDLWWIGDDCYCRQCWEERTIECPECGSRTDREQFVYVLTPASPDIEHAIEIMPEDRLIEIAHDNNAQSLVKRVCYHCASRKHDLNEYKILKRGDTAEDFIYLQRLDTANIFQMELNPEEPRICQECRDLGHKCPRCLRREAEKMEAEETNLWIYDTKYRSYHPSEHIKFKQTKYREKHEHPYLYYGAEVELLFNSSADINTIAREYIKATGGLFVAERDGSVSALGNGCEFISRPLSYKKWMSEEVYHLLEEGEKVLKKYNAYSPQPNGCGLHIHMSKRFFEENTKKEVQDIKADIDWMFQIFQPEMEKISRRKYTQYCMSKAYKLKQALENSFGRNNSLAAKISLSKSGLSSSVNNHNNHHDAIVETAKTIEIRTFKTTEKKEELLATIEFCRAIAHAARNKKLDEKTTLEEIIFCKDSKYLPNYIKEHKVKTNAKFKATLEV